MRGDASAKQPLSALFSARASRGGRSGPLFSYFSLMRAYRRKPRNSVRCVLCVRPRLRFLVFRRRLDRLGFVLAERGASHERGD
jgi:hypothetical protein